MNGQEYSFSGFRLIRPPKTSTVSFSELRIGPAKFVFNTIAAAELGYPPHIAILLSDDCNQLAVLASEPNEYTFEFYVPHRETEGKKKTQAISVGHSLLIKAIRKGLGWPAAGTYRIPGMRISDNAALLFDLTLGECGKRKRVPLSPDDFLASCPTMDTIQSSRFQNVLALPPVSSF